MLVCIYLKRFFAEWQLNIQLPDELYFYFHSAFIPTKLIMYATSEIVALAYH